TLSECTIHGHLAPSRLVLRSCCQQCCRRRISRDRAGSGKVAWCGTCSLITGLARAARVAWGRRAGREGERMVTLGAALAVAPIAHLVRASCTVVVTQDLDGECAISVRLAAAPLSAGAPRRPHRCASAGEVLAYLASGAVPGVRGDELDWVPGAA